MAANPHSLRAGGSVRRRKLKNRFMEAAAVLAAAAALAVLGILVGSVLIKGLPALNVDLFTHNPVVFGESGGGLQNAFVGTIMLVVIATAIALPIGILVAIYLNEFASRRVATVIRLGLDVLNGIPSVVIGLFIFGLLVVGHGQSGWAGSIALAVIMLPLIARSSQEVLALVPNSLREAGHALGVSNGGGLVGVIFPPASAASSSAPRSPLRAPRRDCAADLASSIAGDAPTLDPSKPSASVPFAISEYSRRRSRTSTSRRRRPHSC